MFFESKHFLAPSSKPKSRKLYKSQLVQNTPNRCLRKENDYICKKKVKGCLSCHEGNFRYKHCNIIGQIDMEGTRILFLNLLPFIHYSFIWTRWYSLFSDPCSVPNVNLFFLSFDSFFSLLSSFSLLIPLARMNNEEGRKKSSKKSQ